MNAGLGEDLKEVIEVVTGDGLLQLREDLLGVGAIRLDELLLLVLGLDVGLALIPEKILAFCRTYLRHLLMLRISRAHISDQTLSESLTG